MTGDRHTIGWHQHQLARSAGFDTYADWRAHHAALVRAELIRLRIIKDGTHTPQTPP